MAFLKRSLTEIIDDAITRIKENTPITNFKEGAIARSIVEAIAPEFPTLYNFMEDVRNSGFISTATGQYLDFIGALFSYERRTVSTYDASTGLYSDVPIDDDTYRYEISQRVLVAANANYQCVRLTCLAVPGVADVIGKEYSYGTGSFSVTIVPEFGFTMESVQGSVQAALDEIKAYGIKAVVVMPIQIPLELQVQLVFQEQASMDQKNQIRVNLKNNLYQYFGSFTLAQNFIYNDLVQQIMDASTLIQDFTITKFYLNNTPALLTNQTIHDDEMIVPAYIDVL